MGYSVSKIARLAGISIRTLRYYDKIGLLSPTARTPAGYRIYIQDDVEKLQQILFYKELGFPLAQIKEILDDLSFDRRNALKQHIRSLETKARYYEQLAQLARETLINLEGEMRMDNEALFKGFDYDQMLKEQEKYERETEERWGHTDAYKESRKKTAGYKKEDWEKINRLQMQNLKDLCDLYKNGAAFDSPEVQETVSRARKLITDNFYECSLEIFSGLGQMYVSDERFTAYYEKFAPGLATYYNDAIQYYCIVNA
ncbi:MAG TPA: MerR family transcriptional regulator [Syntrophomonadaceae bacterium]|nr:MerR family transcriptional regulator [Syntrophomonadaceae bacterium]